MRKRKTITDIKAILREHRLELHDRYHVQRIAVFGSYARGDATLVSDVDILVELDQPVGWEIVDLHSYLQQITGMKVDLLTKGAVARRPLLWRSIQENLVYV